MSRSPSPPMLPPPPPADVIEAMSLLSNNYLEPKSLESDFSATKRKTNVIARKKQQLQQLSQQLMTAAAATSPSSKAYVGASNCKDRMMPHRNLSPSSNVAKIFKISRKLSPPVQRPSQLPVVSAYNSEINNTRSEAHKGRIAGVKRSKISPGRSPKRMATSRPTILEENNRSRSPSESASRQSSPDSSSRFGPRRKSEQPETNFSISQNIFQLQQDQMYLLQRIPSQHRFIVAQNSIENIFTVQIGPQICSCSLKDVPCVHLLFILLRVFKLSPQDRRIPASKLHEQEVEALFRHLEESFDGSEPTCLEEVCAICFFRIETENLSVYCSGSQNCLFHQNCVAILIEDFERKRPDLRPICPSCGVNWNLDTGQSLNLAMIPQTQVQALVQPRSSPGCTPLNDLWNDPFINRDPILLPCSAPIPQQHWTIASGWIPVFGRDLVACFFSRDWELREAALHRLSFELTYIFRSLQDPTHHTQDFSVERVVRMWRCATEILTRAMDDKVYKVYLAAIKALHVLIVSTREAEEGEDKSWLRPIIQSILLKCADANRRISQLSLITMLEFAKGSEGELRLGREQVTDNFEGIDLVLQTLLVDDREPYGKSWQYALGRLVVLDSLLRDFSTEFLFDHLSTQEYERTIMALDFGFRHLLSSHTNVCKMARKVFVAAAKLSSSNRESYDQVLRLISTLDPNLQVRMKRRLSKSSGLGLVCDQIASTDDGVLGRFLRDGVQPLDRKWNRPPLIRSTSHSPSRAGSQNLIRSGSQSPSRKQQPTPKRTTPVTSATPARNFKLSRPLKSSSKGSKFHNNKNMLTSLSKYNLSDIEETTKEWNFSLMDSDLLCDFDEEMTDHEAYLQRDKENWLRQSRDYLLSDCEEDFQSPLPIIYGLTCPNPDELTNAHETVPEQLVYSEGSHWTRGSLLGTGAYSSCYQARDIGSGTLMAVKQIKIFRTSESEQERVEQLTRDEVRLMCGLNHRHIVRMFGAVQEGSSVNLFIEWMAGGSVASLLDKHGAFTETVILRYTQQILLGLHYLHSFGILHRDLKGANLLVDTTGQHLRIGDFGAAARLSSSAAETMPGEFQGQLQGTIAFMAPEVLRGESYGRSCDIWSLGCCIIEMSTTKPPWNASDISNSLALIYKIAGSRGPPSLPSHLSPELTDFSLRCLDLIPEMRPSAENLLQHSALQYLV